MKLPTAKNIHIDSYSSGLSRIVNSTNLIKLSQNQNRNVAITNANKEIRNSLIALKFVKNIGSENIGKTPVEFFQKMNNDSRA